MRAAIAAALVASGSALHLTNKSFHLRASTAVQDGDPPQAHRQVLSNYQNVQYYGEFHIGGQPISGIFDTGSFELLVRSTRCTDCEHPTPPYDRRLSTTYVENGTMTKHVFGSGPCTSMKGYDDVNVGPLMSKGQIFWEIVEHQIPVLDTAKFAAIVGIGPNFAYGHQEQTLLMNFGVEEFSICLQRRPGSDGYLTWGPIAEPQYKEQHFAKANVVGKHHWVAKMRDVSFKPPLGEHLENPCGGGCAAIIDSGTSLIAAPSADLMQLSKQIQEIKEDCSNLHELPTLHFNIDGTDFALPPQAYVMRVTGAIIEADSIWDILFFKPKIVKVNMCLPAFMEIDMNSQFGPVWILGMPFFRYYHTIFDRRSQAMYFALAGDNCEALPFNNDGTHGAAKKALLAITSRAPQGPMDVDVHSLVPPTLSEMIDGPMDM